MNDTETEARRLLAAATGDRPPGIDLLDGFGVARRRDRGRRMRRRAAASAGIAAAAASVIAAALTIGAAPSARATVTSALTKTLAQRFHATMKSYDYYTKNGQLHSHIQTCTYDVDPVRRLEASSCTNYLAHIAQRLVGGYLYSNYPDPAAAIYHPGKHWERTRDNDGVGVIATVSMDALSGIRQADTVIKVGPVSGPGWTGTRYAFTKKLGKITGGGTVDVDQQGRTRVLVITERLSATSPMRVTEVVTFSDYGEPVTVTPPPADQTFDTSP